MARYGKRLSEAERQRAALDAEAALMELERAEWLRRAVPRGWASVERDHPVTPKKARVTLLLDDDLARWFRSQGRGYQARVNAVLRAYMAAKLADLA